MYNKLTNIKNVIKIILTIVTLMLVSVTLHTTFSSYVESDYNGESENHIQFGAELVEEEIPIDIYPLDVDDDNLYLPLESPTVEKELNFSEETETGQLDAYTLTVRNPNEGSMLNHLVVEDLDLGDLNFDEDELLNSIEVMPKEALVEIAGTSPAIINGQLQVVLDLPLGGLTRYIDELGNPLGEPVVTIDFIVDSSEDLLDEYDDSTDDEDVDQYEQNQTDEVLDEESYAGIESLHAGMNDMCDFTGTINSNWTNNTGTATISNTVNTNGWNRTGNITIANNGTLIIPQRVQGGTQTTITGTITINAGGRLIMCGGRVTGNGTRGVVINGGRFYLHGGEISGNRSTAAIGAARNVNNGGGIRIASSNSRMIMTGGRIHNNSGTQGGGILVYQATNGVAITNVYMRLSGGEITNNSATTNGGGGIDIISEQTTANPTFNVDLHLSGEHGGVELAHNRARENGGAIQWNSRGTLNMEYAHIHSNRAGHYTNPTLMRTHGGGIAGIVSDNQNNNRPIGPINITGGIIEDNWSRSNGGGVSNTTNTSHVTIGGSTIIRNNTAETGGGGIWRIANGNLIITDNAQIYGNRANSGDGGAILHYIHSTRGQTGNLTINSSDVRITNNTAGQNGGGIRYSSRGTFTLSAGVISGNRALGTGNNGGGGISVTSGTANITGGTIGDPSEGTTITANSNRAINGAGVHVTGGTVNMSGGVIQRNVTTSAEGGTTAVATGRGGGVFITGGEFNSTAGANRNIQHNLAANGGGAFVVGGAFSLSSGFIYDNHATDHGGGVAMSGGTFNLGTALISGNIIENNAEINGGGVHINSTNARFNFNHGIISDNEAGNHGGGVYLTGGVNAILDMPNTAVAKDIVDNNALAGGGVYVHNGTFNFNNGGVLARNAATGTFTNIASGNGHGGGVYLTNNGRLNAPAGSITNNQAPNGDGGGIFTENHDYNYILAGATSYGNLTIGTDVTFTNNTARFSVLNGPKNPGIIAPRVRNALVSSHPEQHIFNNDDVNYYFEAHNPAEPLVLIEKTSQRLGTQLPLPQVPTMEHGILYTLRISNPGNVALTGLVVEDALPLQLINPRYLQLPPGATGGFTGDNETGHTLSVTLDTMPSITRVEITFIAGIVPRSALLAGPESFMNTATVTYPNNPDVGSQDIDRKNIEFLVCPPVWDYALGEWTEPISCAGDMDRQIYLQIIKTSDSESGTLASPTTVELGEEIEYRVEIRHGSISTALTGRDITVHDVIPEGLSFNASELRGVFSDGVERPLSDISEISYTVTGNRIDWIISELDIKDTFTLIVPTTVNSDLTEDTDFINTANLTAIGERFVNPYKSSTTYHRLEVDRSVPFEFVKRDAVSLEALEDAHFHLYRQNEDYTDWETTPMATSVSDENGWVRFPEVGLMPGNSYRLTETQAPDGFYTPGGYWIISVDEYGTIYITRIGIAPLFRFDEDGNHFYLINKRMSFEFLKTGATGYSRLQGAVFHIYERNDDDSDWETEPLDIITSDIYGWSRVMTASLGQQYRLVEVEAPTGFYLPTGYWIVTIATNGVISFETVGDAPDVEINDDGYFYIINIPMIPTVPITGVANNTILYSTMFFVVTNAGLAFIVYNRKRAQRSY